MKTDLIIDHICQWLNDYCNQSDCKGFVVGISGGIDSAVTSTLAAKTTLPTLCVYMPIHQAPNQASRAQQHIQTLQNNYPNVSSVETELSPVFDCFTEQLPTADTSSKSLALANSRARLRMTTLYYFAGLHNYLVAGTGNKVEDFGIGFYTKYGDGGVDVSPIADLMKSEVYQLAAALAVNTEIIQAPPTDGLWGDDRTDEDQLGASYDELEWAMEYEQHNATDDLSQQQQQVLTIYRKLNQANQHKMKSIPVCTIPPHLK